MRTRITLICGVSGSGKSTYARKLIEKNPIAWLMADDIREAMITVSPKNHKIRLFADYSIYEKINSPIELANQHLLVKNEVSKAIGKIIQNHIYRNIDTIIEGDDITVDLIRKYIDKENFQIIFMKINNELLESRIRERAEKNNEIVTKSYEKYIEMVKYENKVFEKQIVELSKKARNLEIIINS